MPLPDGNIEARIHPFEWLRFVSRRQTLNLLTLRVEVKSPDRTVRYINFYCGVANVQAGDMKDHSTVSSSAQRRNSITKTAPRFNFKQDTLRKLPLKALFFGLKHLPEDYNIVFRPYSKSQANGFSIKGPANYMETITFAQSVANVAIGGISVSVDPCAQFTIKALDPRIPHCTLFPGIGKEWGGDFQQGSAYSLPRKYHLMFVGAPGCRGTVTVKFNTRDNRWSDEAFNEFQFLCKNAAQHYCELVGPAANDSVWNEVLEAAGGLGGVYVNDLVVNEEPKAESSEHRSGRGISDKTSALSSIKFKKMKQTNLASFNLPSLPEAEFPHMVDKPAVQDIHASTKRREISPTRDIQSTRTSTTVDGTPAVESNTRDVTTKPGLNLLRPVKKHRGAKTTSGRPKHAHMDIHDIALVHSPTGMTLEKSDLNRIPSGWFNDNLINFLLKLWNYELLRDKPALANQIHVFNSWFYQKLSDTHRRLKIPSAPRWDRNVDIFSKKFLIVPINELNHWYLAIIYRPDLFIPCPQGDTNTTTTPSNTTPSNTTPLNTQLKPNLSSSEHNHTKTPGLEQAETLILIMDSLGNSQARAVEILGKYLQIQGEEKNTGNLKRPSSRVLQVPQQPNYMDCGVYLLHFVQVFVEKVEHLINVSNTRPFTEVDTDWEGARLKGLREEFRRKMDDLSQASWRAEEQRERETP
ncbi:hypothetical protein BDP27DRAFT_1424819 [Rhodocollybia butyracea]|uniref:Ubiquitin-like protease family profile domain-containing protein n=1 Tax=Rhodocollybia butyracea TaxID=206335 RepID=A0A9P5PHL7_9AGAR|nr:hypothetical protein BDP27DRAFT_1424819 [Rhodocollybia butyracea]